MEDLLLISTHPRTCLKVTFPTVGTRHGGRWMVAPCEAETFPFPLGWSYSDALSKEFSSPVASSLIVVVRVFWKSGHPLQNRGRLWDNCLEIEWSFLEKIHRFPGEGLILPCSSFPTKTTLDDAICRRGDSPLPQGSHRHSEGGTDRCFPTKRVAESCCSRRASPSNMGTETPQELPGWIQIRKQRRAGWWSVWGPSPKIPGHQHSSPFYMPRQSPPTRLPSSQFGGTISLGYVW